MGRPKEPLDLSWKKHSAYTPHHACHNHGCSLPNQLNSYGVPFMADAYGVTSKSETGSF